MPEPEAQGALPANLLLLQVQKHARAHENWPVCTFWCLKKKQTTTTNKNHPEPYPWILDLRANPVLPPILQM